MPKEKPVRQTIVIIPEDEELAEVSTFNRRWINRMDRLTDEGKAQEVEATIDGAREWQFDKSLIKLPFARNPREWTADQRQEARERLAAVREAVKASKAPVKKGKVSKAAAPAPTTKTLVKTKAKAPAAPAPKSKVVVHPDRHEIGKMVGGKKLAKVMEEDDETQFAGEDEEEEIEEEAEEEELEEVVVKKAPAKKVIKRH